MVSPRDLQLNPSMEVMTYSSYLVLGRGHQEMFLEECPSQQHSRRISQTVQVRGAFSTKAEEKSLDAILGTLSSSTRRQWLRHAVGEGTGTRAGQKLGHRPEAGIRAPRLDLFQDSIRNLFLSSDTLPLWKPCDLGHLFDSSASASTSSFVSG